MAGSREAHRVVLLSPHPLDALSAIEMAKKRVAVGNVINDITMILLLLAMLCVPLIYLPSPFTSIVEGLQTVLHASSWVLIITLLFITGFTLLLLGEAVHKRWFKDVDPATAAASSRAGAFEQRQGREKRAEQKVESFVKAAGKEAEKLSGGLLHRKGGKSSQADDAGDAVELQEMKPTGSSSSRRRTPPPPPPL